MMVNLIKHQTDSILQVPLHNYPSDFTFVVNGEHFPTSKIYADLLSSKISKLHQADPTISEYTINTNNKGDFHQILHLLEFNQSEINDNQIRFFSEIIEKLEIEKLDVNIIEPELNLNNITEMIKKHDKTRYFYSKKLSLDIDFLSENFYQLNDEQIQNLGTLHEDTIKRITSNDKLSLYTEDQLLKFILKLCHFNIEYNSMFEYVYFENVSNEQIELFVNNFNIEYMTMGTWKSISKRLFHVKNFNRMKKCKIFKEIWIFQ